MLRRHEVVVHLVEEVCTHQSLRGLEEMTRVSSVNTQRDQRFILNLP